MRDAGNVILAMQVTGLATLGDHTGAIRASSFRSGAARRGGRRCEREYPPDPDGRIRYAQLLIEGQDGTTYYRSQLVTAAHKVRADLLKRGAAATPHRPGALGDRVMPIDRRGGMSIYLRRTPDALGHQGGDISV